MPAAAGRLNEEALDRRKHCGREVAATNDPAVLR